MGIRDSGFGIRGAGAAVILLLAGLGHAAIIDRIAVVVGNTVITEREVLKEVRLTEFMNQQPLELGAQQRKAAAERLVDQQLIRNEMSQGAYPMPTDADVDQMLRGFRQQHFGSIPQYRAALAKYGITEEDLKEHLRWELAALRFTDMRFQPNAPGIPSDTQSANRLKAGTAAPAGNSVDQQLDAWLKEQRANTRVQFKQGAFQ